MISHTTRTLWLANLWLLLGFALAAPLLAEQGTLDAITLDAASSEVDYKTNTVLFRDLSITQGETRVTAERARSTGLDFDDSTWTLSGRVRITVEGGDLQADTDNVIFKQNRITRARIDGTPATFSQSLDRGGTARGEAQQIIYEIEQQTVTLSGQAWLTDSRNEIRGEPLIYNLREQRVQAGTQTGSRERVQIIIRPTAPKSEPKTPEPKTPEPKPDIPREESP